MSQEFTTRDLIKRARLATNDRQKIYRANITFLNTNKGSEQYEDFKYVSVNGRNYRLFDGKDHILPEEVIEALKDAVGYKSVQTREQDLKGGVNYDDPMDAYTKIKIDNFIIHIIEEVTPGDLKEKIRLRKSGGKALEITDEQEEAAARRASVNVVERKVQDVENEVNTVRYPEDKEEEIPVIEDEIEEANDTEEASGIGSTELDLG